MCGISEVSRSSMVDPADRPGGWSPRAPHPPCSQPAALLAVTSTDAQQGGAPWGGSPSPRGTPPPEAPALILVCWLLLLSFLLRLRPEIRPPVRPR